VGTPETPMGVGMAVLILNFSARWSGQYHSLTALPLRREAPVPTA